MAWRKSPQALVALFDASLPDDPRVERRKMFGYPAAFANGYLFAGLHQEDLILRLPAEGREEAVRKIGARPFEPMPARTMRDYVALADAHRLDVAKVRPWMARAFTYAQSLPPKPAKRAKAKPAKKPVRK